MHSLYEIETNIKRVARYKGLSWGISEEIGKAVRILEQSELPGFESFYRLIKKDLKSYKKFENFKQSDTENLCPIHFGIYFQDNSHNENVLNTIYLKSIIEPILIIPFLLKAAKKNLLYIKLSSKEFSFSLNPGLLNQLEQIQIPLQCNDIKLEITKIRKPLYNEDVWNYMYNLSLETFVEETEEKKLSGAGAGLTDND